MEKSAPSEPGASLVELESSFARPARSLRILRDAGASFHERFGELFGEHFPRLFRYLDRLSGEPDLAADLAQDAFVKLYRRGSLPDSPEAWLISVATNLFRNEKSMRSRRQRLLTLARGEGAHSDPPSSPGQLAVAEDDGRRVRQTLDRLPQRDKSLLLLRAEGYSYRDIAAVLELNETSVGTLLARARQAFRKIHEDTRDAR